MCWRQSDDIAKKQGHDMSMEDFLKVIRYVKSGPVRGFITFAGNLSDPIHHPSFIEFLKICSKNRVECEVQTASSFKSEAWFIEAFKANRNAIWQFGIDGLPEDSHTYRINQDGKKLFTIMEKSINYLHQPPVWQYIVFNYNEDHVEYCKQWAKDIGCKFKLVMSGKTTDFNVIEFKKYLPSNEKYKVLRNNNLDKLKQFETYMYSNNEK
jgi:hypothetical protein